jgi:hypothetical protein
MERGPRVAPEKPDIPAGLGRNYSPGSLRGMAMKKNQAEAKSIYELWWDYLKQSLDYEKLCISFQKNRPNLKLLNRFISNWKFFGDVHSDTFDRWWSEKKDTLIDGERRAVWNVSETFIQDSGEVIAFIQALQRKRGEKVRKPTAEEFVKEFSTVNFPGYVYLKISTHCDRKREELEKEIFKVIKQHKKSCHDGKWGKIYDDLDTLRLGLNGPIGVLKHKQIESLKEYLNRYEKGRPDLKDYGYVNDSSEYRGLNDQYLCAERIIKNVEGGVFPGEFRTAKTER